MRVDFDSLLYTHKHTGLVNHNFISIKRMTAHMQINDESVKINTCK